MNKYDKNLFRNLLKSNNVLDQHSFLKTMSERNRQKMLDTIAKQESDLMITRIFSDDGITIILPKEKIPEANQIASFVKYNNYSNLTPIEELIPKKYSDPFLIKEGEKEAYGNVCKYAFCHSHTDVNDITCFVINQKEDIHPIHLGSIYDPSSKISQFLKEIDARYPNSLFTREDLKINLSKKLIQNNQPTKAAVEYLCHTKFLIRYDYVTSRWSKFERTGKKHPITLIDEIVASTHDITKPYVATIGGAKYAYHEEDGFYPVLL